MGIDEDELDAQTTYNADDIDPEGEQGKLEDLYQPQEGTPQFLLDELYNADVWGPEAVLLAGFRAEEIVMVRVILDSAGGEAVKVVPCMGPMLYETVEVALQSPEPEWNEPRPEQWTRGGAWGAQRVILFSGMKLAAQAALVELLEGSGLPPVCIAVATQDLADTVLGEVLAAAVKEQRGRKNPKKEVWDNERMSAELPDIKDMVGDRLKDIQAKFDEGKLEDIFEDPGHGPEFTATNEAPFESSGVMQTIRSPGGGMSVDDVMAQAEQPPTAADRARNGTGSAGSTTNAGESPNRRWPFKAAAKPGVSPVDKRFGAAASVASQAQSEGSAVLPAPAYGMPPGGTRPATMTRAELQAFAERSGRSFEALLADAQAKGVRLAEE
ncbi:hypothetical protein WJX72_009160 [[Myrmecia] bisecta]|uniref:Uncharacterized protein n=1 Tax=[Myrmecia] bisecta TaxID=41462 RepID=A0AAW1QAQ3_9CHLO